MYEVKLVSILINCWLSPIDPTDYIQVYVNKDSEAWWLYYCFPKYNESIINFIASLSFSRARTPTQASTSNYSYNLHAILNSQIDGN